MMKTINKKEEKNNMMNSLRHLFIFMVMKKTVDEDLKGNKPFMVKNIFSIIQELDEAVGLD